MTATGIASIPGVCEVERFAGGGARDGAGAELLVELPHGATRERDFDALVRRLESPLPPDLREFFFVNTDVGAPECAAAVARSFVDSGGDAATPPRRALVLRSLLPRTLCDCNRVVETAGAGKLTPAIPDYVTSAADRELLGELHARYDDLARRAFEAVCGAGGTALVLHTYAPRSVGIERIDAGIVEALREAYRPENYERWPRRPAVDVISESDDGTVLAPRELVAAIKAEFADCGVQPAENSTYRLHAGTSGLLHAQRWPGRVLCIEFDRAELADPFTPFREMRISEAKVRRMTSPLVAALRRAGAAPAR